MALTTEVVDFRSQVFRALPTSRVTVERVADASLATHVLGDGESAVFLRVDSPPTITDTVARIDWQPIVQNGAELLVAALVATAVAGVMIRLMR